MRDWNGSRVVIIGAARQGLALARYLAEHGAQVVLTDRRSLEDLGEARQELAGLALTGSIEWVCGQHPLSLLDDADLVCPSGGVALTLPLVVEAQQRGIPLSNDSQIFLEAAPCKVIGITGSAGKTTTTTLVGRMTGAAEGQPGICRRAWVGGNIGQPLIAFLDQIQPGDLAVMELSSFQLEIMDRSPAVAAILNVTPNHLDRHGTMAAYSAAKAHILEFQRAEDVAVLGRDDPGAWSLRSKIRGRLLSVGLSDLPAGQDGVFLKHERILLRDGGMETEIFPRDAIMLRGQHNLLNAMAAVTIAAAAGLPVSAMQAGVEGFTGVQHRLEFVRRWGGAAWYNDSIATAPERVMAAIRAFDEPLVLLVGGRDKDLPWEAFAELAVQRVDHLVMFGEAAGKIEKAIQQAQRQAPGSSLTLTRCDGLHQSVQVAARLVQAGDIVLLSPGGTSFDEFKDFEERGECFVAWVNELT